MQIALKNVGYIKEAKVGLTGLNVVAGPNGTGKSTIGKTIYTIIKSISDCDNIAYEHRKTLIHSLRRSIFHSMRNDLEVIVMRKRSLFEEPDDMEKLMSHFGRSFEESLTKFLKNNEYEQARELINHNIALVDSFSGLKNKSKSTAKKLLNDLLNEFTTVDRNDKIEQSLRFMYQKMFRQQVNSLNSHEIAEVFLDNNGNNLKYHISNNVETLPFSDRLVIDDIGDDLEQCIFLDATFIETPLILQVADNIGLPFHWNDITTKLTDNSVNNTESNICNQVYKELSCILGGELVYIDDKQDFFFVHKGTDNKLYVSNMASGEKMLGILQKMAKLGLLLPEHLLILDEPENHLHPEWQIRLAKILITLVDNSIPILLTTHSATLIDALQEFAEAKGISDKARFYFADQKKRTIKDVKHIKNKGKDIIFESFYNAKKFLPDR